MHGFKWQINSARIVDTKHGLFIATYLLRGDPLFSSGSGVGPSTIMVRDIYIAHFEQRAEHISTVHTVSKSHGHHTHHTHAYEKKTVSTTGSTLQYA